MRPPVRPPRLRCTLFSLTYPPHLLVLPATFGLHLFGQTYPHFRALYVISIRRTKGLPTASFRFHLTMDTLAVQLYTSSLPRRVRDFHPLERAHGAQTHKSQAILLPHLAFFLSSCPSSSQGHECSVSKYSALLPYNGSFFTYSFNLAILSSKSFRHTQICVLVLKSI